MSRPSPAAIVLVAFIAAPLLGLTLRPARFTVSAPALPALGLALLMGTAAVFLFGLSLAAGANRRARRASRPGEVHREVNLVAAAAGALVAGEALLLAVFRWELALAYAAVSVAYALLWIPPAMRRIGFRAAVVARCTPQAAFDLVSDPGNWPRYWPNLELRQRPTLPLHTGDVIHDRVTTDGLTLDAEELVTDYVPGREFGTSVIGGRGSRGVYQVSPVDGGMEIAYVYSASLTLPEAWLGNAIKRGALQSRLRANRLAALLRIKHLLEAERAQL